MAKSGIYEICNMINGKRYVGSALDYKDRLSTHKSKLRANSHPNKKLQNSWNKYQESAFEFRLIECVPKENLIVREQHWIDAHDAVKSGFNIRAIAESNLGIKFPKIHGERISAANLGHAVLPETRAKISAANKGREVSPETRARLSFINRSYRHTSDARDRIAKALLGHSVSIETRKKISSAHKGRKISVEHKEKLSQAQIGKKQSKETIEKRVSKLRGRKQNPDAIARAWITRRANNGQVKISEI